MILYFIYKDKKKLVQSNFELKESVSNSGKDIEMNMDFVGNEKIGADTNCDLEEVTKNIPTTNGKWGDFMVDLEAIRDILVLVYICIVLVILEFHVDIILDNS